MLYVLQYRSQDPPVVEVFVQARHFSGLKVSSSDLVLQLHKVGGLKDRLRELEDPDSRIICQV